MKKSTTENVKLEPQHNSEPKDDGQHVSPAIGNTNVSCGLAVGKTVWVVGSHRHNSGITETIITKVGKKYFEVEKIYSARFFNETLLHDGKGYSSSYRVYLSKQEYLDELEVSKLSDNILKTISQYGTINLPLEKLREIWNLMLP